MTTILTRDTFAAGLVAQGTTTVPTPVNDTDASTKLYADSKGVPVGGVLVFTGTLVPTGWLMCNGALVSRSTYSALFAIIGTMFGVGDGSTTFALPSMQSMIGVGTGFVTKYHIIKT
jgi:Phage Tail Collar Domain